MILDNSLNEKSSYVDVEVIEEKVKQSENGEIPIFWGSIRLRTNINKI